MTTTSATNILTSEHAQTRKRVSTLLLRYPRCIHSELMTHRVLSRNSASSRAIPVKKLIQDVLSDPFIPVYWGKNQSGMQAKEELTGWRRTAMRWLWLSAMYLAVSCAFLASKLGAHKQIVNRLLEPFAHITVVVTATNWSNFLALRDHPDAEPHIAMLARAVRIALDTAPVQVLKPGEWHLPFITDQDKDDIFFKFNGGFSTDPKYIEIAIKISVARCASTSYKTVEGFDMTLDRAIALCDKLFASTPLHASPAEHQCMADTLIPAHQGPYGEWRVETFENRRLWGNLEHFVQYRKTLANESL